MKKKILIQFLFIFLCINFSAHLKGNKKEYKRVISLAPNITEIMFALSCEHLLAGNTTACNYPEKAKKIYKVGDYLNPDLERILSLNPDIILADDGLNILKLNQLKKFGIDIRIFKNNNFQDVKNSIKKIGKILKKQEKARSLLRTWDKKVNHIRKQSKGKKFKVLVMLWHNPVYVPGRDTFISDLLKICNCKNITDDGGEGYFNYNSEKIIEKNPDIIISVFHNVKNGKEIIKSKKEWRDIKAVKKGYIYDEIDPDLLLRPGPRMISGLEELFFVIKKVRKDMK